MFGFLVAAEKNKEQNYAVVVAQLVEQSLLTPEIRGLNPVIGKMLSPKLSTNCIIEKTKKKEKVAGNGPSLKEITNKTLT